MSTQVQLLPPGPFLCFQGATCAPKLKITDSYNSTMLLTLKSGNDSSQKITPRVLVSAPAKVRMLQIHHLIYRIENQDGVKDWAETSGRWEDSNSQTPFPLVCVEKYFLRIRGRRQRIQ